MWVMTVYVLRQMIGALNGLVGPSASAGPFASVWVGLLTDPTPPLTDITNMSGITEASYHGYARQQVAWYPPFVSAEGPYLLEGHSLIFTPSDGAVPNNITGVMLCDAPVAGNYLCGVLSKPTLYPLTNPTTSLVVDAQLSLGFGPNYGGPDLSN